MPCDEVGERRLASDGVRLWIIGDKCFSELLISDPPDFRAVAVLGTLEEAAVVTVTVGAGILTELLV